jgi:hypothetical protein
MCLPNFLIVGAQKAGTTSLANYLNQHPNIFMCPVKETHYFTYLHEKKVRKTKANDIKYVNSLNEYRKLFSDAKEDQFIGEASPSYLYNSDAPFRIKKLVPDVKIIAILRNPVDRAYSNFLHARRAGYENIESFEEAIFGARSTSNEKSMLHYLEKGLYHGQLERYYNLFDKDQIHIDIYESFKNDPNSVLKNICKFLNTNDSFNFSVDIKYNNSGIPKNKFVELIYNKNKIFKSFLPKSILNISKKYFLKKPIPIENNFRQKLYNYFETDINKLEMLLDKNLSIWKP